MEPKLSGLASTGATVDEAEVADVEVTSSRARRYFRAGVWKDHLALALFVIGLFVFFTINAEVFATEPNLENLARQAAVIAIMAAGQLFVILAGGIDISVGAQVSILSIIAVKLSTSMGVEPGLLLTLLIGMGIGLINGLLVTVVRISPIIATIAMWQVLIGLALLWTDGAPLSATDPSYNAVSNGSIWFLDKPTAVAILAFGLSWFLLNRSSFGRHTFAVGGNAEAARLSGIRVKSITVATYMVCSLFTAVAAILLSSRVSSGSADLGTGLEITVITAVFIGGVAWGGGAGSVFGVLLGVALIAILANGLQVSGASSYMETFLTGLLMAVAVGLGGLRKRRGTV